MKMIKRDEEEDDKEDIFKKDVLTPKVTKSILK